MPPCTITDQATDFGLDQATPGDYAEVTAISDHAVLSGQVRLTIGRSLLIDTPAGPVLLDMRKAAGWTIRHARPGTPAAGLSLTTRQAPRESHDVQPSLF
jgi:hypothetical protein